MVPAVNCLLGDGEEGVGEDTHHKGHANSDDSHVLPSIQEVLDWSVESLMEWFIYDWGPPSISFCSSVLANASQNWLPRIESFGS